MKISKQNRRDAKDLFRAATVNGVLDEARAGQVVDEVLKSKPRGYAGILSHFQRLLKLDQARRTARVESAMPVTPELENNFRTSLERKYGRGLYFQFQHNPDLLGGVQSLPLK